MVEIDQNKRKIKLRFEDGHEAWVPLAHSECAMAILDDWHIGTRVKVTVHEDKIANICDDS